MTATVDAPHNPVLLSEVLDALSITPGEVHVDGTFGAGGYSKGDVAAGAIVHAFDRDPDAIAAGQKLVDALDGDLRLHATEYSNMAEELADDDIDGVTLDIGVSSMQLDQAERGFSFQQDGPLDMRMAQDGESAADFLNNADEAEIADVIYRYGEERKSRRIARAIVAARPLSTTLDLANVVRKAVGQKPGDKKDPATRTFQAIRIFMSIASLVNWKTDLEAAEKASETWRTSCGRNLPQPGRSHCQKFSCANVADKSLARSRHLPEVSRDPESTQFSKTSQSGATG